ncbi:FG-GAP-like repeat-containing protein [Saccharomonospora sp. NPDC046836]|uniref:FG-GAP-like repeat-containing protein n=1 Tax=Saccharomonospora sp. NPDC046836 TaxID=3156921 RepID=UPI0033E184C6
MTVTALAATMFAAPAHAISGGSATDTTAQPFLAKIKVGSEASCSGALITPEWLATSGTCFAATPGQPETPDPGPPHTATTATIGGQTRQIDRIAPHNDRDLVLAHLDRPVYGILTPSPETVAPTVGQAVQVSGYGRTENQWVPDQAHTGDFTIGTVDATELSLQGSTGNASICKGDAGAPVLSEGKLVAVASRSYQAGCLGETSDQSGAIATRVDDITDWLVAQVLDLHATPASKNAINLSWVQQDPSLSYRVYGAQTENVAIIPANLLGETSEARFVHQALPKGQSWHYRVTVVDAGGTQIGISFTAHAESPTSTATDFNGDGIDDIVAVNGTVATVATSNTAQFGTAAQWSNQLVSGTTPLSGDFNGDGKDDLATVGNGPVDVYLSDGARFGPRQRWHDILAVTGNTVLVGDVNGDGLDDMVVCTGGSDADVYVSLSTGTGFGPKQLWNGNFVSGTRTPALGDFNGDGKDDIASFGSDGLVWILPSDGTRFAGPNQLWHNFFSPPGETPAVGDFNGDGRDDIATFVVGGSGRVYVSLSTGTNFIEDYQVWHGGFGTSPEWIGTGDFNGDGKSDAVTFTRGTNADVFIATSNGTAFGPSTKWHDTFAAGSQHPLPTAHRR